MKLGDKEVIKLAVDCGALISRTLSDGAQTRVEFSRETLDFYTAAIEKLTEEKVRQCLENICGNRCNAENNPCEARDALAETKMQWIDVSVERPKFIEGKDYSENVFGIYKDYQGNLVLSVFQLIYVDADAESSGWVWAKISENYSDLRYAECEFDDNYEVILWSPIFELPKLENE